MKSILNKAAHEILKLTHSSVACSAEERETYLKRASDIQNELREWVGIEEREKIGLGQNCNASWYLKATGNKRASYPFDWIFTTPEFILDMLGDDFEKLLDRSLLIPHGIDAGHQYYHEWLFGHRNPANSAGDHEFFKRCVVRWNELMQSQKPVVFVTVVLNESDKRKRWKKGFTKQFQMPTDQKLSDFDGVIQAIIAINHNCKFLFIEQYTEVPFELSVTGKNENAFWLKFCAIDRNTGVQYLNAVDDEVMKMVYNGLNSN
ncbi:MAG: hypothetical protein GC178_00560 [Flavobacteriales bacterium]|nr:hypothetical protein [Flavobacteriales bacterium]